MAKGDSEVPAIVSDVRGALELRRKVLELTEYIQSRNDIKVDGKSELLR